MSIFFFYIEAATTRTTPFPPPAALRTFLPVLRRHARRGAAGVRRLPGDAPGPAAAVHPGGPCRAALRGRRLQLDRRPCRRSEEHTSELQSRQYLVCRLLLEKKKNTLFSS